MKWQLQTIVASGTAHGADSPLRLMGWLCGERAVPVAATAHDESRHATLSADDQVQTSNRPPPLDAGMVEQFRRLMLPQLDAAHNLARYLTRDASHAEDCVQEAYVRALRAFPQYRGGDPRSWMLVIVRNCCLSWLSTQNAEKKLFSDDLEVAEHHDSIMVHAPHLMPPSPDAELARADAAASIRRLVENLPALLRDVLVLREIEDLSYRQIAAIVNAPIGTVMSRLARARAQLAAAFLALDAGAR